MKWMAAIFDVGLLLFCCFPALQDRGDFFVGHSVLGGGAAFLRSLPFLLRIIPVLYIIEFDRTYCGMIRDVVCQRRLKIKRVEKTLKLRFILDRFSVELFVNDGAQTFTSTFYTPAEAEDIVFECDKKAVVNIEKYTISLDGEK